MLAGSANQQATSEEKGKAGKLGVGCRKRGSEESHKESHQPQHKSFNAQAEVVKRSTLRSPSGTFQLREQRGTHARQEFMVPEICEH